ncbi:MULTISPECIES: porin [unclassified Klebsiella]|uniref:porin n=1 Tax=unclassified Klebsiella TaxID=2608929 RepID=UPI0015DC36B0|nr:MULTISPECIES: porin [unclassified Klebsiella]BBQ84560.1 phosphoporin PhoE [Klebsiella sp. WP3-W18-ESBL-02]BBR21612.1 phosphoporin PhoE [Klebsiella sp. WP3-S18-ESBL-05]
MIKRNILAVVIPALLVAGAANAAEIYNKNANKLDFYGKAVGEHIWTTNGNTSNEDTTYARIGFKGETQINDQLMGYGQWEYNMDASNAEGSQGNKTRLAFAGLKFGDAGSLDYGRNYGAIYDVAAYTDMLVEWGGDSWAATDNFMNGRSSGLLTYRNSDFFGLVDGLSFALQYQGKNDRNSPITVDYDDNSGAAQSYSLTGNGAKANGDGFSTSAQYDFGNGMAFAAGYEVADRTNAQVNPKTFTVPSGPNAGLVYGNASADGSKAEAWSTAFKYDANNVYAAVMYAQTLNMTRENDGNFAEKTQNIEAVVQYQFDFGLRPSIGYVQSKGKDLHERVGTGFKGGDADLVKYIEVGTWYYFNKNMNVYAAYKFNLLDDNAYSAATGLATDDQAAVGIVYQF